MLLVIGDSFTYGDELQNREKDAWPYLLSSNVINLGKGGASNDRIFRLAIEETVNKKYDLVIIGWSFPNRFETCYRRKEIDLNLSHINKFTWLNEYFTHHYDENFSFKKQFVQIIALQNHFKFIDQKYIFCNVAGLQGHYEKYKNMYKNLINNIDDDYFVGWPYDGMLEWQGNCDKGPKGHPLELGHQRIASVIKKHIEKLKWENIL